MDVVSELANVRERLERIEFNGLDVGQIEAVGMEASFEWRERLDKLVASENRSEEGKVAQPTMVEQRDGSLSDIDKRLAMLEQAVGPITDRLDQVCLLPLFIMASHYKHFD